MDFEALKALLDTNPDFATATDQELADWANEKTVQRILGRVNSDDLYELIDGGEFTALSQEHQNEVWNILLLFANSGVPTAAGTRARSRLVAIFGGGSTTINNVVAAITYTISRVAASDAGADEVNAGEVAHARSI